MKNVSLLIDIIFCVIVLPVMAILFPIERWFHTSALYVISVALWLYIAYFLNRLFAAPWIYDNGSKRIWGILLTLVSVGVTYLLSQVQLYVPKPSIFDYGVTRILPTVAHYQQAVWTLFVIVESYSFGVGLLTQANLQKSRRRAVEAERDKAELELYKAQIKPHFMFNTLNSLYGLFLTGNDKALASLEKFIAMMQYMHTSTRCDMVPLADEVDYIREFVDLQSLRLNEMTTVEMVTDIADDNIMLPPMLLITFVENCFKHGVSPVEKSNIFISLTENAGHFRLFTSNHIFPRKNSGHHTGIENCRKRLDLLFPDSHMLMISDDNKTFKVELTIDLSNS